jgi:hypothetical protein
LAQLPAAGMRHQTQGTGRRKTRSFITYYEQQGMNDMDEE